MPTGSWQAQTPQTSTQRSPTVGPPLARPGRTLPRIRADLGAVQPGQVRSRPSLRHGPAHLVSASGPAHSARVPPLVAALTPRPAATPPESASWWLSWLRVFVFPRHRCRHARRSPSRGRGSQLRGQYYHRPHPFPRLSRRLVSGHLVALPCSRVTPGLGGAFLISSPFRPPSSSAFCSPPPPLRTVSCTCLWLSGACPASVERCWGPASALPRPARGPRVAELAPRRERGRGKKSGSRRPGNRRRMRRAGCLSHSVS